MARIKLTRASRLTLLFLRLYLIALLALLVVKFILVLRK